MVFFGDVADRLLNGRSVFGSFAVAQASLNPITGDFPEDYRGYRANEVAWYVQDQWKIHPRLTVNLGLRWEYFGPPHNFRKGLDSNVFFGNPITPIPSNGNPFFPTSTPLAARMFDAAAVQVDQDIWHKDTNNFGPRVVLLGMSSGRRSSFCGAPEATITTGFTITCLRTSDLTLRFLQSQLWEPRPVWPVRLPLVP